MWYSHRALVAILVLDIVCLSDFMWKTVITVVGKDFQLFQQYDEALKFFAY